MNVHSNTSPKVAIHPLKHTTPFPNHYLDTIMPALKDTEWRLICILIRQTQGWKESSGPARKKSDWLTHSQLKQRSGRASQAVSSAITSLIAHGLIEVLDHCGIRLDTAQLRRRSHGKLYFRLREAER